MPDRVTPLWQMWRKRELAITVSGVEPQYDPLPNYADELEERMRRVQAVSLACDGPCGTVITDSEKAPVGWSKIMITVYEQLMQGQKPTKKAVFSWLCPKCTEKAEQALERAHIALSRGQEEVAA